MVAERMLGLACTGAEAESLAAQAFEIAFEANDWLIGQLRARGRSRADDAVGEKFPAVGRLATPRVN
jgi:hypothetical protein